MHPLQQIPQEQGKHFPNSILSAFPCLQAHSQQMQSTFTLMPLTYSPYLTTTTPTLNLNPQLLLPHSLFKATFLTGLVNLQARKACRLT